MGSSGNNQVVPPLDRFVSELSQLIKLVTDPRCETNLNTINQLAQSKYPGRYHIAVNDDNELDIVFDSERDKIFWILKNTRNTK